MMLGTIEIPDCVQPEVYHAEPMIFGFSFLALLVLTIAITIMVINYQDNKRRASK